MKSRRAHRQESICERSHPAQMSVRRPLARQARFRTGQCMAIALFAFCSGSLAANWQSTVSKEPPGDFPGLRPLHATYRFGWSGLTAATGESHFTKTFDDKFQLVGTGRTIAIVRALWKLDVNYRAVANADTLRPIETEQTENYRSKKADTHITITNNGVTCARTKVAQTGS